MATGSLAIPIDRVVFAGPGGHVLCDVTLEPGQDRVEFAPPEAAAVMYVFVTLYSRGKDVWGMSKRLIARGGSVVVSGLSGFRITLTDDGALTNAAMESIVGRLAEHYGVPIEQRPMMMTEGLDDRRQADQDYRDSHGP